MRSLGIDHISVFALPPVAFVELAAELGCDSISLGLGSARYNPEGYPSFSIRDDLQLRRELRAALQANGVHLALGDSLPVMPGQDGLDEWRATLDMLGELGARRVGSVSFEPDFARNVDQYGRLAELCRAYAIVPLIEFVPIFAIADLPTALAVIEQVGASDLGLIIDTMQCGRTGVAPTDLQAIAPDRIGYVQLCDVPLACAPDYMDEAMYERLAPGDGELPLRDYLAALPRHAPLSLEIPQRSRAQAGEGPRERLAHCVSRARSLLHSLP
ncbi:sugar phosphate isomerase/epimerase [Novosphingobium chloroacetimidivorans]|uniref:Sugar phosphate isomerase/epimerase n=1 Tax=Novosphingobium chloroacetimidivorans TaxID=1428314 RepID=A0A7W7KBF4_9SPHN|nr:TIM barrel protein [Novosphingobium chloroacetimidivorans]MBB4859396.1 sugar phosphate isomerase/epimerase [Novosphingobium chloroacetimidivorans]